MRIWSERDNGNQVRYVLRCCDGCDGNASSYQLLSLSLLSLDPFFLPLDVLDALQFLEEQQQRIDALEHELLESTEDLLPLEQCESSSSVVSSEQQRLTTPELAQSHRQVHTAQERQLARVARELGWSKSIPPPKQQRPFTAAAVRTPERGDPPAHSSSTTTPTFSLRSTAAAAAAATHRNDDTVVVHYSPAESWSLEDGILTLETDDDNDDSVATGPTLVVSRTDEDDSAAYCPTVVTRKSIVDPARVGRDIQVHTEHPSSPDADPRTHNRSTMLALGNNKETATAPLDNNNNNHSLPTVKTGTTTCALDRYRLERDDQSPNGFKVVPNFFPEDNSRSKEPPNHRTKDPPPSAAGAAAAAVLNNNNTTKSSSPRVFETVHTNTQQSAEKANATKRPLRKSTTTTTTTTPPYPTVSTQLQVDENAPHLQLLCAEIEHAPLEPQSPLWNPKQQQHSSSILPPSRLYATTTARAVSAKTPEDKRADTKSTTKGPSLFLLGTEATTKDESDTTNDAPPPKQQPVSSRPILRAVSQREYDAAPRIVQMQVTVDEIETAQEALRDALLDNNNNTETVVVVVAQTKAHEILKHTCRTEERKAKHLIMSLCHFRRLRMRRDARSGTIVFDVVVPPPL
jgi:hypothetical protein